MSRPCSSTPASGMPSTTDAISIIRKQRKRRICWRPQTSCRGAEIELSPCGPNQVILLTEKRKPLGRRLRVQRRALRKCQGPSVRYADPLR